MSKLLLVAEPGFKLTSLTLEITLNKHDTTSPLHALRNLLLTLNHCNSLVLVFDLEGKDDVLLIFASLPLYTVPSRNSSEHVQSTYVLFLFPEISLDQFPQSF